MLPSHSQKSAKAVGKISADQGGSAPASAIAMTGTTARVQNKKLAVVPARVGHGSQACNIFLGLICLACAVLPGSYFDGAYLRSAWQLD